MKTTFEKLFTNRKRENGEEVQGIGYQRGY